MNPLAVPVWTALKESVVVRRSLMWRWRGIGLLAALGGVCVVVGLMEAGLSPAVNVVIFGFTVLLGACVSGIGLLIAIKIEEEEERTR